jgi:S1-C subfamily serine protease
VREVAWAKELTVGPLTLTNVSVQEANKSIVAPVAGYVATLGLAALDRQDVIIDGKNGVVYFARQPAPAKAVQHNRLGAVFAPGEMQHDDLLAHVAAGSPAEKAGIRNGDLLLKIDAVDVTKWRTDPAVRPGKFWQRPAGTTMNLTLKRGEKEFTARVTLRDILGPGLDPTAKPSPVLPQPEK